MKLKLLLCGDQLRQIPHSPRINRRGEQKQSQDDLGNAPRPPHARDLNRLEVNCRGFNCHGLTSYANHARRDVAIRRDGCRPGAIKAAKGLTTIPSSQPDTARHPGPKAADWTLHSSPQQFTGSDAFIIGKTNPPSIYRSPGMRPNHSMPPFARALIYLGDKRASAGRQNSESGQTSSDPARLRQCSKVAGLAYSQPL